MKIVVIVVFLVLLIFLGLSMIIHITHPELESAGQFGDSFGSLTSLFSALAFGGIIATFYIQLQDLKIQREELKLTRKAHQEIAYLQSVGSKSFLLSEISRLDEINRTQGWTCKQKDTYDELVSALDSFPNTSDLRENFDI